MIEGLDDEFAAGYRDGRDPTTPDPSMNRSAAYRHSFAVGRAEIGTGEVLPAAILRDRAARAEEAERAR